MYVIQIIVGALFLIVGISGGIQRGDMSFLAVGVAIGAGLIFWGFRSRRRRTAAEPVEPVIHEVPVPQEMPVEKTFSFRVTGTTHQCRFPKRPGTERSYVIARHRVGDAVYPKLYEWEGRPAVAIMSKKEDVDVGVVPATMTMDVVKLMEAYDIDGTIIAKDSFSYRGNLYNGCEVQLNCRTKRA